MEDTPTTRAGIAGAITDELSAMGQEDSAPPPSASQPSAADAPDSPAAAPAAPAADAPPAPVEPLALADTSLVVDPADGQTKTWGEVKAERLRWKDYTQKTQSVAEERRAIAAERDRIASESKMLAAQMAGAKALAAAKGLPQLPEDDPYAQHQALLVQQQAALQSQLEELVQQQRYAEQERANAASQAALEAEEQRLTKAYEFTEREIGIVEAEYWRRRDEPGISLDSVAQEFKSYLDSIGEKHVKQFKEKHRVSAPAATTAVPAAAPDTDKPRPGTRGFTDMIREELASMMGT